MNSLLTHIWHLQLQTRYMFSARKREYSATSSHSSHYVCQLPFVDPTPIHPKVNTSTKTERERRDAHNENDENLFAKLSSVATRNDIDFNNIFLSSFLFAVQRTWVSQHHFVSGNDMFAHFYFIFFSFSRLPLLSPFTNVALDFQWALYGYGVNVVTFKLSTHIQIVPENVSARKT